MSRLIDAIEQIVFARRYTVSILETIPTAEWFRMPVEGVSHVAWQVGHLAMAHYRLGMERVRGALPTDESLISQEFLKTFGRDSVVDPDPANYPTPESIRHTFDSVHQRLLEELATQAETELDLPPRVSHRLCTTRIACLRWCAAHEMLHAGQVGVLRRLFGQRPIW